MTSQEKLKMFDECRAALEAGKNIQIIGFAGLLDVSITIPELAYNIWFYEKKFQVKPDRVLIPCDQVDWVGFMKDGGYGVEADNGDGEPIIVFGFMEAKSLLFYSYKHDMNSRGHDKLEHLLVDQSLVPKDYLLNKEEDK